MSGFSTPDLDVLRGDPTPVSVAAAPAPAATTRADAVLAVHHDRLMALDGVVMLGRGRDAIGDDAIVIGVKRADQRAALPQRIDGVPVVAETVGEVDALPAAVPR